jgi:hypothetical protein
VPAVPEQFNSEILIMNAICVYDITVATLDEEGKEICSRKDFKKWLEDNCKKWCFQLEVSETGYRHFQGRFSLGIKKRMETLINGFPWKKVHFSPTSNENRDNMFYCFKEHTAVEGPWKDTDPEDIYIPWQLQKIGGVDAPFWPWQKVVIGLMELKDVRVIDLIYNPEGGKGKTTLASLMDATRQAIYIPFCNDYKDLMRMVMDQPKYGNYFVDLPRALKKDKLNPLYAALETIKGGMAYDDRYKFKKMWFNSPNIFVFSNILPDFNMLTQDRWRVWFINERQDLEPFYKESDLIPRSKPLLPLSEVVAPTSFAELNSGLFNGKTPLPTDEIKK